VSTEGRGCGKKKNERGGDAKKQDTKKQEPQRRERKRQQSLKGLNLLDSIAPLSALRVSLQFSVL